MRLHGHRDERLQRSRVAAAFAAHDATNAPSLREQRPSMGTSWVPDALDLALARDATTFSTYPAHFVRVPV